MLLVHRKLESIIKYTVINVIHMLSDFTFFSIIVIFNIVSIKKSLLFKNLVIFLQNSDIFSLKVIRNVDLWNHIKQKQCQLTMHIHSHHKR